MTSLPLQTPLFSGLKGCGVTGFRCRVLEVFRPFRSSRFLAQRLKGFWVEGLRVLSSAWAGRSYLGEYR